MKPKGLVGKAFWILRNRPSEFLDNLLSYAAFRRSALLMPFLGPDPAMVAFGRNVRLQRLRSVSAERPDAHISVGEHSIIYENAHIAAYGKGKIEIGSCSVLGDIRILSRHSVKVGSRFLSSWNVYIQDFDPHPVDPEKRGRQVEAICAGFRPRDGEAPYPEEFTWDFPGEPVEIGDDVWVGANATILKGARIGSGSIVASGAVVLSGVYPPRSILAGNPARVVKTV